VALKGEDRLFVATATVAIRRQPQTAAVNDLHTVEEVIQIQPACLSPSTGTAYGAMEMD
jgi:hypothetical protein